MSYPEDDFDNLFQPEEPPLTRQDIQRQVINTIGAIQQANALVQQQRAAALERAEQRHPGFQRLYDDPQVTDRYIRERKAHANLIGAAESGQGGPEDLDELYHGFYLEASKYETSPQPQQPSRVPKQPIGSAFSLEKINSLPLGEKRHAAIQALGDRVADLSIDEADPNAETFKLERGEK